MVQMSLMDKLALILHYMICQLQLLLKQLFILFNQNLRLLPSVM